MNVPSLASREAHISRSPLVSMPVSLIAAGRSYGCTGKLSSGRLLDQPRGEWIDETLVLVDNSHSAHRVLRLPADADQPRRVAHRRSLHHVRSGTVRGGTVVGLRPTRRGGAAGLARIPGLAGGRVGRATAGSGCPTGWRSRRRARLAV